MDWELYERYRATTLLAGVAFLCFILLFFQDTSAVRHVRTWLVRITLPTARFLSQIQSPEAINHTVPSEAPMPADGSSPYPDENAPLIPSWSDQPERLRKLEVLSAENRRLRELLDLKQRRWPKGIAAHVSGRDPQRWFQEIVLDKGHEDGVDVDDPVIAVSDGREGLVGRVIEVGAHVSKVMLVNDSLSAVAATAQSEKHEDGVVEGTNSHDLLLRFLDRGSQLKIGDLVVASGLGKVFPEGVPIGWVAEVGVDPRQLFLQARLRPAVRASQLRVVLILAPDRSGAAKQ